MDYFLQFVEDAEPKITGAEQREWLARMELEEINLRFALEASVELPGHAQKGLRLLAACARFVEVRGLFKEARTGFERLLAHPDAAPRNAARARALAAAGRLAWVADDTESARAYFAEAHTICRELGDAAGAANALAHLALHDADAGDLSGAERLLNEAAQAAAELSDRRLTAQVRRVEGTLAAAKGEHPEAFALYQQSFALFRELGDAWMAGIVEWTLGVSAVALGRFDEARAHFAACLTSGLDLGNRWGVPYPLEAFAVLALAEHQYERGAKLLGAAEALRTSFGMSPCRVPTPPCSP